MRLKVSKNIQTNKQLGSSRPGKFKSKIRRNPRLCQWRPLKDFLCVLPLTIIREGEGWAISWVRGGGVGGPRGGGGGGDKTA